ncbi:MAG: hypothetical protein ABIQ97_05495 [Lysobacteraceae bacterium]
MTTNKFTMLMCSVGLAAAGGCFSSQVLAMDAMSSNKMDNKMDNKMMPQEHMMGAMDSNHDGMISAAEHAAYGKMMFDKMDSNHDGMVSKDEMMAAHKMMHDKMMSKDDKEDMMEAHEERMEDMKHEQDEKMEEKMEGKK